MQKACEENPGTMASILGLGDDIVKDICSDIEDVFVANYNAPGQIVISGTYKGVQKASEICKGKGAKRAIQLNVAGPFHSPFMKSAQENLKPFLDRIDIKDPSIPFVSNVTGDFMLSAQQIRESLLLQITSSVLWEKGIQTITDRDLFVFYEIGCGKVLKGLQRKINSESNVIQIDNPETLREALEIQKM